ncbi:MAG TPA: CPBP family intramembrane glutamic endopeptidase [Streptosporangiaceae bacterium]
MRHRDTAFAVATGVVLAAYNNVISRHRWHQRRYVTLNLSAAGVTAAAALASGLTPADLGLGDGWWRPGRLAAGLAAGLGASWAAIAAIPATRPVLADQRITSFEPRTLAFQAAVRIPAGTVLWEEIAFRGVLQASLRRVLPPRPAIAVTAAVFGAWHIRPTIAALRANGLAAGPGQAITRGVAGSAAMAAAGGLLSWLRESSGGLAAPALLHLTANAGGLLAAWAVSAKPGKAGCR